MTQAERIKLWNEIAGHTTAADVWLFVVCLLILVVLSLYALSQKEKNENQRRAKVFGLDQKTGHGTGRGRP